MLKKVRDQQISCSTRSQQICNKLREYGRVAVGAESPGSSAGGGSWDVSDIHCGVGAFRALHTCTGGRGVSVLNADSRWMFVSSEKWLIVSRAA